MKDARELDAFRRDYFRQHTRLCPEDAASMGLPIVSFSDDSEAGLADRLAFHSAAVEALVSDLPDDATSDDALDVFAMSSLSRSTSRALGSGRARASVEPSAIPQSLVAHLVRHAETHEEWQSLVALVADVPRFYAEREEGLLVSARAGHVQDARIAECFGSFVLPGALGFFETLPKAASSSPLSSSEKAVLERASASAKDAAARHATFVGALPSGADRGRLGREEYLARLDEQWGKNEAWLDEMGRAAEAALPLAREELVRLSGRVAATRGENAPRNAEEASRLFLALWGNAPESLDDAVRLYSGAMERARVLCREQRIFREPLGYDLSFRVLPSGFLPGTPATNLPAPLLAPHKSGHVLVVDDAKAHSVFGAANLAVHEGFPGHYLQSLAWQRAFAEHPAPVRFFHVSDDVAMAHSHFGTMLGVEGFAAHAEEVMLSAGLYTDEEALLAVVSKAIRAARVLVDIRLHTSSEPFEAIASYYSTETGMPLRWTRNQVLRSMRMPLQVVSYFAGRVEIERLLQQSVSALGETFDREAFYDALFRLGPIPPRLGTERFQARTHMHDGAVHDGV